jgi:hypothetical protein
VVGVDLDRLADARTVKGVRVGTATLRGTWHNRTITVTAQSAPARAAAGSEGPPEHPPCPPPPGGWRPGPAPDPSALDRYLNQHPDRFGGLWIAWPDGLPSGPADAPGYQNRTQVTVVDVVTGDLAATQRELAAVYPGNLCLRRTHLSLARAARVQSALLPLLQDRRNGIWSAGRGAGNVEIDLAVLDQRLYDTLARIGLDAINVRAAVRPVRR